MQHKEKKFTTLEDFCNAYHTQFPNQNVALIEKSITFLNDVSHKKLIFHDTTSPELALKIATILISFQVEAKTIAASIIYSVTHWESISDPKIRNQAPKSALKMADNVSKLSTIDSHILSDTDNTANQADNLRKMILAIVDDPRAVIIKLAEKIIWLGAIKDDPLIDKKQAGDIVMQLYAPLANRLGIGQLKWQLEDLAFRYTDAQQYFQISKSLRMRRIERESFVQEMKTTITDLFNLAGISKINITGRAKHIYSIYRKISRKKVDFNQIYDSTALRILVNSVENCYEALSIIHAQWRPIEHEFDDYIAKPKANGYQSIHTAIEVPEKGHVEIQIRTFEMHDLAELGVAAHWKYKEGGSAEATFENKIQLLRSLLDWQKSSETLDAENYQTIFGDRVYVFSPNGEVFSLPTGATALDFAYLVHTQVGHRCQGAKINGKLCPLTQPLKTGSYIQIITGKEDRPSRDWLNPNLGYLQTHQALSKVKHFFRKEAYSENLTVGEALWEKACRRSGLKKNSTEKIYQRFNFKNSKDLLAALGANDISIHAINSAIKELEEPKTAPASPTPLIIKRSQPSKQSSGFVISELIN